MKNPEPYFRLFIVLIDEAPARATAEMFESGVAKLLGERREAYDRTCILSTFQMMIISFSYVRRGSSGIRLQAIEVSQ